MSNHHMVVIDGTRYRIEDAKRLGLVADPPTPKKKSRTPSNKARQPTNKSKG